MSPIRFTAFALVLGLAGCAGKSGTTQTGGDAQPLTLPNGNGIGANGPGLGMRGPALGQPYPTFEAKQAAIGLAWVTFSNATTVGGARFESLGLVKGDLQGILQDGTQVSGDGFAGVLLHARGLTSNGQTALTMRTVRVDRALAVVPGTPLEDPDYLHYFIEVLDEKAGVFVDPCEGGYAIALPGRWNNQRGVSGGGSFTFDTSVFNFACDRTSVQKCAEAAHYKPWHSIQGPLRCQDPDDPTTCSPAWTRAGGDALQACTRLVRGDFCGDGTPLTIDGTLIDVYDNFPGDGIEPDLPEHPEWPIEARWDKVGAICIDQTRVTGTINSYIQAHCRDRVAACDPTSLAQTFDDRSEPVLLNRSQRKLALYLPAVAQEGALFGQDAAVYSDPAHAQILLAIGAPGTNGHGAVHIFRVSTSASDPDILGAREYVAILPAPDGVSAGAQFGLGLSFRGGGPGPDLLVGASQENNGAGVVYTFPFVDWSASGRPSWGVPNYLQSPEGTPGGFGRQIACTPNGRAFISAPELACGGSNESGVVYVLEPGQLKLARLTDGCPSLGGRWGSRLIPVGDDAVIVAGPNDPSCGKLPAGMLDSYARQADGTWQLAWSLFPTCGGEQLFGASAVLSDGRLFAGALGADATARFHVYHAADAPPTETAIFSLPTAVDDGENLAAYAAAGTRLAVPAGGEIQFLEEASGTFVPTETLHDPMVPPLLPSALGSSLVVAPPFLFIGAAHAADRLPTGGLKANAGYLYHFNFSDDQPVP
jgi:hypothetical protein